MGAGNTALGASGLYGSSTGSYNVALGSSALAGNSSGSWNIALGYQADSQITTGSNNIDIGNQAQSADSNVIRIGTPGTQTSTYIAGYQQRECQPLGRDR